MSGTSTGQWLGLAAGVILGFFTGIGWAATAQAMMSYGAIGYSIGGIIDPPKTNIPDVVGPKADEIRNNMPSENQPVCFVLGPRVRLAGNLIWAGEIIERKEEVITE